MNFLRNLSFSDILECKSQFMWDAYEHAVNISSVYAPSLPPPLPSIIVSTVVAGRHVRSHFCSWQSTGRILFPVLML